MKNWRLLIVITLVAGLALVLAGCGGQDQAETPTTEPTQVSAPEPTEVSAAEPTKAPEPTATPEPTEPPPTDTPVPEPTEAPTEPAELDLTTLVSTDAMTSYRSKVQMVARGTRDGEEVENTLEISMEMTTDPAAQHIAMSGSGLGQLGAAGVDLIEIYTVEGTTYMKMGEDWFSVPADQGDPLDEDMFTPQTFTEDTCGWKQERDTEVLGVKVHHYTVDRDRLAACATADMLEDMAGMKAFDGDLYVSVEGNYLIQMDVSYEGTDLALAMLADEEEQLEEGTVEVHIEYTDINEPFVIEVPEEALASSGAPADIPVPPDATGQASMFGMFTFESNLTPLELSDWYRAEMPDYGWTEDSAEEFGGMYTLNFTHEDGRSASFMISGDSETGVSSVLITVEE